MTQKELTDIYIILEKQYRKAFVDGYHAALGDKINKKQMQNWFWSGKFQNFEIWEDPFNPHQIPVSLQKQNTENKGIEIFEKLKKNLNLKVL
tara:strand:+ start:228 stop:503 length:276 start_codon:yes stop_codon:yes gene_type:complete